MNETNETELITRSKEGNQEAIAELFHRHYPASLHLAGGILRHPDDAQDAVQTAYFLAFRRLEKFRGESSFKTWITRIVVNCCLLQLREARHRVDWKPLEDRHQPQRQNSVPSRTPNPERSAWCGEIASALSASMARLPKHLREPYTLFTVAELPLQEVATSLGLTISATKTRLFRARAWMRTSLKPVWAGARG